MRILRYKDGSVWKKMESPMAPIFKGNVCEASGLCPYLNYDECFCYRFECDVAETFEMEYIRCDECKRKFGGSDEEV